MSFTAKTIILGVLLCLPGTGFAETFNLNLDTRSQRAPMIHAGQPRAVVIALMGEPDRDRSVRHRGGCTHAMDCWQISASEVLAVFYDKQRAVEYIYRVGPRDTQDRDPQAPTTADKVAGAVSRASLTLACPAVYRKPVLFMTASDVALIQTCNANGWMLFGMYIYAGK